VDGAARHIRSSVRALRIDRMARPAPLTFSRPVSAAVRRGHGVLAADPVGRAAALIWSRDLADGRSAEERVRERLAQTEVVAAIQPLPPRHRFAVYLTDVRAWITGRSLT
jgi:hypothetical protein